VFGIRDDEPRPPVGVGRHGQRAHEPARVMKFYLTLVRPLEAYSSVDVARATAPAVAGTDYQAVSQKVLFTRWPRREIWVWVRPAAAARASPLRVESGGRHDLRRSGTGTIT